MILFKRLILLALVSSACLICGGLAKNWALLAQTSCLWENYGDQASVCHAFKTLNKAGIPEENIVVMHYDDIAYSPRNPHPGTIRNSPNGSDVYKGTPLHYSGAEIVKEIILAVLSGDQDTIVRLLGRKGKVINSTSEDNIFVYIADHGSPHMIPMPGPSAPMHARELNETLTKMHREKRYAKLVFYLDTCFSGSMFHNILSPDLNVYAVTATSPTESGNFIFFDPEYHTCLSSEFSCNWLGDTDFSDVKKTTFEEQFQEVRSFMKGSHPHHYGNVSIGKDSLDEFFGHGNRIKTRPQTQYCEHPDAKNEGGVFSIQSNMRNLFSLKSRLTQAPAHSKLRFDLEKELAEVKKMMSDTESLFLDIARPFYRDPQDSLLAKKIFNRNYDHLLNFDCYENAVDTLMSRCPKLNPNINPSTTEKFVSLVWLCNQQHYKDVMSSVMRSIESSPLCTPDEQTF